jgi:hypothetical protein
MGGRGSSGSTYTGDSINIAGKQKSYYLRNGRLQNSQTLEFMPGDGKSLLKTLISKGGKPLSTKQIREIEKKEMGRTGKGPRLRNREPV